MKKILTASTGLVAITSGSNAFAHAGEHTGSLFHQFLHMVSNPDHIPLIIASIAILVIGIRAWFKSR